MPERISTGLLLGTMALLLSSADAFGEERSQAFIRTVDEAEQRYDNLDVRFTTRFRDHRAAQQSSPGAAVERTHVARHVAQGRMFKAIDDEVVLLADGKRTMRTRRVMYDGHRYRYDDGAGIRSVGMYAPEPRNLLHPHVMLFKHRCGVPLSARFRGDADFENPFASNPEDSAAQLSTDVDATGSQLYQIYLEKNPVEVDGLRCAKVSLIRINKRIGRPRPRLEIWLAMDRNHLPVRTEDMDFPVSLDHPVSIATASELREIAPGVWFPYRTEFTEHDARILQSERRRSAASTLETRIESVSLDPSFDESFFRDTDIDTAVRSADMVSGARNVPATASVESAETDSSNNAALPWKKILPGLAAAAILLYAIRAGRRGTAAE